MIDYTDGFEINPELLEATKEARESLEEMQEQVVTDAMNEEERMIVRCLWKGHEFMDVYVDGGGNTEYVGYDEGHEPEWHHRPWDAALRTYDLRDLTFEDIRDAHVEVGDIDAE